MTEQKGLIFRFGEFEVQEGEFCLIRGEETIPVEPKAFRVLLYLLRNPHRLVTKDELLDAVWQETSVSENSLTRAVALLRRLLGDDTREPRFIATVPTVGYRFLANVTGTTDGLVGAAAARTDPEHSGTDTETESENSNRDTHRSQHWRRFAVIGAAVLAIVAVGLLVRYAVRGRVSRGPHSAAVGMRVVPLTALPGSAEDPALSPDGESFAFFWNNENPVKWNLYVQLVGGEKPLQLTHISGGFMCCARWSPDGRQIAFGRCDDNGGGVYMVPALGGAERKITDVACPHGIAGFPNWIADGSSLIVADQCIPGSPPGIVRFSFATGAKQCLHAPARSDLGDKNPALSPDQKTIAFLRSPNTGMSELYTVAASGGRLRQVTSDGHSIGQIMWSADGRRIIFDSDRNGSDGIWQVPANGGDDSARGRISRNRVTVARWSPAGV